jgi:dTDP-4-dehydrorhamnose reductase
MRILVLGATGMLGSAVLRVLSRDPNHEVFGTIRGVAEHARLIGGIDVLAPGAVEDVLETAEPDAIINCVGLIKQVAEANDPAAALPINAELPHRLAILTQERGARLIHISTDCVFSGRKGAYRESDPSDADDLYGQSKYQGEVTEHTHAVTLRTSIIGHERASARSLVDWFLSQPGPVNGYTRAVFSGLPTVELAGVIRDRVLPQPELHGLYHVAASPIDKYSLLKLVANQYEKPIEIIPVDEPVIDRSLDGTRFEQASGYKAAAWPDLIELMHADR